VADAHCHPTDLDQSVSTYEDVPLGGIASMATIPEDQSKVANLASERGWGSGAYANTEASSRTGAKSVACFGTPSHHFISIQN
jgi:hypothetical protein